MVTMLTPDKLRAIRAMRGMSQAELAHRAGVSPVSISTFESGASDMRASTIVKLCEALGVKVTYTVDGTEISGP
jgi:transcriptional regulator with XRE-family HTH domain